MRILDELLPDVYLIEFFRSEDSRGYFGKTFSSCFFQRHNIKFSPQESFFSISSKNVLRGLHFQRSPFSHSKLVFCSFGSFLDVIVDVRQDSPNYNKPISFTLDDQCPHALYIGKGYAHGFYTLSDHCITNYMTNSPYSQEHDDGILWNSIDFDWPCINPIISDRDRSLSSIQSKKLISHSFL